MNRTAHGSRAKNTLMFMMQKLDKLQVYDLWLNIALGIATSVALCGTYFAVFYPFQTQVSGVRTEVNGLRDMIRQASEFNEKQQILAAKLAKSEQAATELARRIPAAP